MKKKPAARRYHPAITTAAALALSALPIVALAPPPASASDSTEVTVTHANVSSEQQDREVDQVAMQTQDIAISRLSSLLKKYRETSQEPVFLSKLADLQQQKAAIQFRVAHGLANHSKKALDLSGHHRTMSQSIATLDRLISRYPGYEDIPHAWFLRGKAYEENENKAKAAENYLHLVQNFPNCEDSTPAYMSLAEFSIEANDHAKAITYLKEVEKRPDDPHYPFALYKMAWSYYNLKQIPDALSYAERHIGYYNDRIRRSETHVATESDAALRENMLLDSTVFFFEGYEENLKPYALGEALSYFRKIEEPVGKGDRTLGKMLLRFAKLLRSHSHEADLLAWKDEILDKEASYPESLDAVILAYEFELNGRKYPQVVACARDMVKLYATHKGYESFPKAQKQVLDTAEGLQALIIKNKGATEVASYSRILAQVYDAFVHMVDETDPRIPRAHYNLAETLFTIQDYAGATEHYRWVVEHGSWDAKPAAPRKLARKDKAPEPEATVADASLKAIAARYEVLHQKGLIPKDLKPRPVPSKDPGDVDPLLAQWVDWLDAHVEHSTDGTENFVFESNRALYAQGQVRRAIERMTRYASKHPKSPYAIPQASLVLDSYIASEDWEKTHDTAHDFMDVPEWRKGDFAAKLLAVASDAFYKQLELKFRKRDYKATLSGCDEFFKRYPTSARLGDALALAGSAALEDIDRKRAMGYFTRLINEVPGSANRAMALLARASQREDHYLFGPAAQDYGAYVRAQAGVKDADAKQLKALRRKTLMLTWLSGDRAALTSVLADKAICTEELATECEKFTILGMIATPEIATAEKTTDEAFEKARRESTGDNRGLYAILALEGAPHLAFRDRNLAATVAAKSWDDLDPLVKFALLPGFARDIAETFRLNRAALKDVAPLKASEKWITHRVDSIREIENAATKVMKLPWARIRAEVLNEVAGIYLDLARGLAALPPPKDLTPADQQAYDDTIRKITMPFEEKGQDMRSKAFEIASRFAIEDGAFQAIAEPFFAENPSQAKALKGEAAKATGPADARKPATATATVSAPAADAAPAELSLTLLALVDPSGGWTDLVRHPDRSIPEDLAYDNPALYLKSLWARAVQQRRLPQVAFFMQEAQEKALIQAGIMGVVKAVSLSLAGARGEGLAELEEARGDLTPDAQKTVTGYLIQYYDRSYAKDKSKALRKVSDNSAGTGASKNAT